MKRLFLIGMIVCLLIGISGCGNADKTDKHTHVFNTEVIAPTCSQEGYTIYSCTTCGFQFRGDFVDALKDGGHNYIDYVCTECGDFLVNEAADTTTLTYKKIIDENNNEAYVVTGVTTDTAYIKIPSTHNDIPVTEIADEAFKNLLTLKHVVVPDGIVSIGESAFKYCFNLVSVIIPESVVLLGKEVFWDCHNLKNVSLAGVTEINDYTFIGCTSIVNIDIPESVTAIGVHAFGDCYNLTSITIPLSVTKISHAAFWNDYNLKDIFYKGTIDQWRAIDKEVGSYTNTNEDASWDAYSGAYTLHCLDGDIAKNNIDIGGIPL